MKLFSYDLDRNPSRFGFCLGVTIGRRVRRWRGTEYNTGWVAFTVDWFAPLGEPNRLYLFGPKWTYMIGLPTNVETRIRETPSGVARFEESTGPWRITTGQRWTRDGGWTDEWSWFVRSPRRT